MNDTVLMLVGLPCTGKSTWLKSLGYTTYDISEARDKWLVLSTDYNVEQMGIANGVDDYHEQWKQFIGEADKKFFADFKSATEQGLSVIVDRTNISTKSRARLFEIIKQSNRNYMVNARVFGTSINIYQYFEHVASRKDKIIPAAIVQNMAMSFTMPSIAEGFTNVYVV